MVKILKGKVEVVVSGRSCNLIVGGAEVEPTSIRYLGGLGRVSYSGFVEDPEKPAYYVYRGVYLNSEQENFFKNHNLRHDITVILPGNMGEEHVRTHGHYHPVISNLGFGEIYQVYCGKAAFILQERMGYGIVGDVVILVSCRGESIYIPPTYGHVTYNISSKPLILGNIVCDGFESEYDEYIKFRGPSYYILRDGSLVRNENYKFKGRTLLLPERFNFKSRGYILSDFIRRPKVYTSSLIVES